MTDARAKPPTSLDDRLRLQRWIAAVGLTAVAEEAGRADTRETNAMALLGGHAACETLLGLLVGTREDRRNQEVAFSQLVKDADGAVTGGLGQDLIADLRAIHRMRNAFVHASNAVHADEAARATSAARRLLDAAAAHLPETPAVPWGAGIATAIANIIEVEAVGLWLRHADEMLAGGRVELAADGCARALDAALARTRPRLRHDRNLSSNVSRRELRTLSAGGGTDRLDSEIASRIEGLDAWVLSLALGLQPATYSDIRAIVGSELPADLGGAPRPVMRPSNTPDQDDVRRALSTVSEAIFRLWATGTLRAAEYDEKLVELAQPFLADPSGYATGGR